MEIPPSINQTIGQLSIRLMDQLAAVIGDDTERLDTVEIQNCMLIVAASFDIDEENHAKGVYIAAPSEIPPYTLRGLLKTADDAIRNAGQGGYR